jgi:hypothetical protein
MGNEPLLMPDEGEDEEQFVVRFKQHEGMKARFPNPQVRASIARGQLFKAERAGTPEIAASGGAPMVTIPARVKFIL